MNAPHDRIESLLRRLSASVKQPQNAPDIDFYLLARIADGTATAEEHARFEALCRTNPDMAVIHTALRALPKPAARVLRMRRVVWSLGLLAAASIGFAIIMLVVPRMPLSQSPPVRGLAWTAPDKSALSAMPTQSIQVCALEVDNTRFATNVLDVYDRACGLLIGINDYDKQRTGFDPLRSAVRDLTLLTNALGQFQFSSVETLVNSQATRANILRQMTRQLQAAGPNGSLFIYYAGHGCHHPRKDNTGYFVPYDGSAREDELDAKNISNHDLLNLVVKVPVKHVYIAADCCFAGLFSTRGFREYVSQAPDFFYLKEKTAKPVVQLLAASDREQQSIDGLFTEVFCAALGQAANKNFLTAAEIDNYTIANVQRIARSRYAGFKQNAVRTKLLDEGGEFVFVRTNQTPLAYVMPEFALVQTLRFPSISNHVGLMIVDLDDDRTPEYLAIEGATISVVAVDGGLRHRKTIPGLKNVHFVNDMNDDGCQDIAVSVFVTDASHTTACIRILDHNLATVKTFMQPGSTYDTVTDHHYHENHPMQPLMVDDLDNDGQRELLANVHAGFGVEPRELRVFDFASTHLLWRFPVAGALSKPTTQLDPNSGRKKILFSTSSPGNGHHLPDGTDDEHSYVHLLAHDGIELWHYQCGDALTRCSAGFVDMDHNGRNEILVAMSSAWEERQRHGRPDVGNVFLLDQHGDLLRCYTNELSIGSLSVVPNYTAMRDDVLLAIRTGKLMLLDANLTPVIEKQFDSISGKMLMPYIQGMLNTRYGELLVVMLMEIEPIVFNASAGLVGPDTLMHYHNMRVALLDKKTLEPRFAVPVLDFSTNTPNFSISIYDTDADDQDELLICRPDRIDVYKLAPPAAPPVAGGRMK